MRTQKNLNKASNIFVYVTRNNEIYFFLVIYMLAITKKCVYIPIFKKPQNSLFSAFFQKTRF